MNRALRLDEITSPEDPRLAELAQLLNVTFADPNVVLGVQRLREFMSANRPSSPRHFFVLVATDAGQAQTVVGGSIFSYVISANCGFSEYIVADPLKRGLGLGRQLFDRRQAILDAQARLHGHARCHGLFIEVDDPYRTPPSCVEAERVTALDARQPLRVFAHFGFQRVDVSYVQPPLGPGKTAVDYMDLLFAPWAERVRQNGRIPAAWVLETLQVIWSAWAPAAVAAQLAALRQHLDSSEIALQPLVSTQPTG